MRRCGSDERGGSTGKKRKNGPTSNLPFDVDFAEGGRPGSLKECAGLACQKGDVLLPVFEKMLAMMIDDELGSIRIGLKGKLLSNEAKLHVRLVPAIRLAFISPTEGREGLPSAHVAQRCETLPHNEHIHEICPHVGCVQVKLEEFVVVAQGQCRAHLQGVLDRPLLLLCCC